MVKRLRHRPFTAVTRVRFSYGSPGTVKSKDLTVFLFLDKAGENRTLRVRGPEKLSARTAAAWCAAIPQYELYTSARLGKARRFFTAFRMTYYTAICHPERKRRVSRFTHTIGRTRFALHSIYHFDDAGGDTHIARFTFRKKGNSLLRSE